MKKSMQFIAWKKVGSNSLADLNACPKSAKELGAKFPAKCRRLTEIYCGSFLMRKSVANVKYLRAHLQVEHFEMSDF